MYGPTGPVNNFSSISLEYVLFPTMTVVFFFLNNHHYDRIRCISIG